MVQMVENAAQAITAVSSGQTIWVHSMAATPVLLVEALAQHALGLEDITVMQMHLEHAEPLANPELFGHLRNRAFFACATTRELINQNQADYVPIFLSEIPKLLNWV